MVLRKTPTTDSMPSTSVGRPATVIPNTTSSVPAAWPSTSPSAVATTEFRVTPIERACPDRRAVSSGVSSTDIRVAITGSVPTAAGKRIVGSERSANAPDHAAAAASSSCPASHAR
ncbi:hypothetical protein GCM10023320_59960 [Pseudonocardia adelaidensis]|uniref:Uncharacterized protein n=1 Tax=Pseudonocardia adelaidensis TaxID=648754 RepID=A0ABP9NWR0_9PSEU